MNTALATLPVELENGEPVRVVVTSLPDGSWTLAYARRGGLHVDPFWQPYRDVRKACAAAEALNARSGA